MTKLKYAFSCVHKINPSNVVHVCAWCHDKEEREKLAERQEKAVSHGVCEEHAKKRFR
jgi:hypothetical protein